MSRMFGSVTSMPDAPAVRRQLLVKASLERWSDLLKSVEPDWDIVQIQNDELFYAELSRGKFLVAAIEATPSRTSAPETPPRSSEISSFALSNPANNHKPAPVTQVLLLQEHNETPIEFLNELPENASVLTGIRADTPHVDFQRWLDVAYGLSQLIAEYGSLRRRFQNRRSALIGNSAPLHRLREQVGLAAQSDWPVLIQGEPGTGRELVAQSIHEASDRAHRPFIKIDCRVYSSTSLSRELFGEVSTTLIDPLVARSIGIDSGTLVHSTPVSNGRLELAEGGVLLIEGIDEIALPLQAVLSQVIERKCFQRMGERRETPCNVRIMAITSKDLGQLSHSGHFREDLLKHFVGPVLQTTPLRETPMDIAPLAEHLLHRIAGRLGVGPIRLFSESVARLQAYSWPGNVSELESLLERACLLNPNGKLTPEMIDSWLAGETGTIENRLPGLTLAQMERQLIEATFTRCAGNRELTAQSLQIGLRTLSGKLREYGYPPRGGPGSNRRHSELDAA